MKTGEVPPQDDLFHAEEGVEAGSSEPPDYPLDLAQTVAVRIRAYAQLSPAFRLLLTTLRGDPAGEAALAALVPRRRLYLPFAATPRLS